MTIIDELARYKSVLLEDRTSREPVVSQKDFVDFVSEDDKKLGLVIMGAGEPLQDWVDGIADLLLKEKIAVSAPVFSSAFKLIGNVAGKNGRTDLALIFNNSGNIEGGRLAMWRLHFGDASWVDDFIVNYGKDYGQLPTDDDELDESADEMQIFKKWVMEDSEDVKDASNPNEESIERLKELRDEMLELVTQAADIIRQTGDGMAYRRAKSYWIGHIKTALGSEEYDTGYETTILSTIEDLSGATDEL